MTTAIKARLEHAAQLLELETMETQARAMQSLRESWAGPDDGQLSVRNQRTYHNSQSLPFRGQVSIMDTQNGSYYPYYETEQDLWHNLAVNRWLFTFDSMTVGSCQTLRSYTISGEWDITVKDQDSDATELAQQAKAVIDTFLDRNSWWEVVLPELHDESRCDGERYAALYPDGDTAAVDMLAPEHCREPFRQGELNELLETPSATWFYGTHCRLAPYNNRIDWSRPLGYHFIFDDAGEAWEYLPSWPQANVMEDSRCCVHYKRNALIKAARGVSDYFPIADDMMDGAKLARNIRIGSACQAAITGIRKVANATKTQALNEVIGNAVETIEKLSSIRSSGPTVYKRHYGPATELVMNANQDYAYGPMGQPRGPDFIEVANFVGRRAGTRWNMPEYLITGDASNSNLASTLAATSPFMKYVGHQQSGLKLFHQNVFWRVLRMAYDAGRFGSMDWREFEARIDVEVIAPKPEQDKPTAADAATQTTRNETLFRNKIITGQTWATMEGVPEEEAAERPVEPQPQQQLPVAESWRSYWRGYP